MISKLFLLGSPQSRIYKWSMGTQKHVLLFVIGLLVTNCHSLTPAQEVEEEFARNVPEAEMDQIVHEFQVVDRLLHDIVKGSGQSNGIPIKNRTECTVSQDALVGLRDHIQDIMSNVSTQRTSCDFTAGVDNCEKWLKLIQCGVQELGDGFRNATSGASIEEVAKWKNAYDSLMDQYQKEIDNVKSSLSEEFQKKIDELNTQLQNLSAIITQTQEKLKDALVKLCASEIGNGKIDSALSILKEIDDDSKLKLISRMSYEDYGRLKNVENIVAFVKKLRTCDHDNMAYPGVYEGMKEHNEFTKPYVTTLYEALKPCMCTTDIKKDLEKYVK